MTHTPGPWQCWTSPDGRDGKGWLIVKPETHDDGTFRHEADARLIAAAPDLLEALESVLRLTKVQAVLESWELGTLETLIAEAKGEA